jgi:oligopeptide/dipeptide ABC transporter ATP-binding protein
VSAPLLSIEGLRIEFGTPAEPLVAVKDVGLTVGAGEIVGLVGESGSGKSLTCRSVLRLLTPPGRVTAGSVTFAGRDVLAMSNRQLREFRAHDVTTQAQILALLERLRREQGTSVLLVSHDFGVIAQVCDRVAVMYGGHVVESGPLTTLYDDPQHPYTRALLSSVPSLHAAGRTTRRAGIPGSPPELTDTLPGCVFAPRCAYAEPVCTRTPMALVPVAEDHGCACVVRPFAAAGADR